MWIFGQTKTFADLGGSTFKPLMQKPFPGVLPDPTAMTGPKPQILYNGVRPASTLGLPVALPSSSVPNAV